MFSNIRSQVRNIEVFLTDYNLELTVLVDCLDDVKARE
jgi:hypothetical protein